MSNDKLTTGDVNSKEMEKLTKYADLRMECEKMWHLKSQVVPIVVGATGAINTGFTKNLRKLPAKFNCNIIQKITILGTAHILRKSLNIEQ